jgi:hypothetical protein
MPSHSSNAAREAPMDPSCGVCSILTGQNSHFVIGEKKLEKGSFGWLSRDGGFLIGWWISITGSSQCRRRRRLSLNLTVAVLNSE